MFQSTGPMSAEGVPQRQIQAALERLLASPDFQTSERNKRFLRHVVEETLAGRAERIKAYSIATLVFGRNEDFDAMKDSILRIEAGRLRRALDNYYLKHGGAEVRISIPKGSYVPHLPSSGGFPVPRGRSACPWGQDAAGIRAPDPSRTLRPGWGSGCPPLIARTLTRQVARLGAAGQAAQDLYGGVS